MSDIESNKKVDDASSCDSDDNIEFEENHIAIESFHDTGYVTGQCFPNADSYKKLMYFYNNLHEKKDDKYMEKIFQLNEEIFNKTKFEQNNVLNSGRCRILNMYWSNLIIFGENNHIDFTKLNGIVHVDAPNKVGKSSLLDCIEFILFNKTSNVNKSHGIINQDSDGKAFASMDIEKNGDVYRIIRMRQTGKNIANISKTHFNSKLLILNKETNTYEIFKTDNLLETVDQQIVNLFGCMSIVENILFMSNDKKIEFLDKKTDCDVYAYFSKFFNLQVFDELSIELNKKISSIKTEMGVCKKFITENKHVENLDALIAHKDEYIKTKNDNIDKCENLNEQIKMLMYCLKTHDDYREFDVIELNDLLSGTRNLINRDKDLLNNSKKYVKNYDKLIDSYKIKITDTINEISKLSSSEEVIINNAKKIQPLIKNFILYNNKLEQCSKKRQNEQNKISSLESDIQNNTIKTTMMKDMISTFNSRMEIEKLEEEYLTLSQTIKQLDFEIANITERIGITQSTITHCNNYKERLNSLIHVLSLCDHYSRIVARNGIPFIILSHYLPQIETKANNFISMFSDVTGKFHLKKGNDTGRTDKRVLRINMLKINKNVNMKTASNGESFWVNFGMRMAMHELFNSGCQIIALDESLHSLDEGQIDINLDKFFEYIKNRFSVSLIISHRKSISKKCNQKISIQSDNGKSYIICTTQERDIIKSSIEDMIRCMTLKFKDENNHNVEKFLDTLLSPEKKAVYDEKVNNSNIKFLGVNKKRNNTKTAENVPKIDNDNEQSKNNTCKKEEKKTLVKPLHKVTSENISSSTDSLTSSLTSSTHTANSKQSQQKSVNTTNKSTKIPKKKPISFDTSPEKRAAIQLVKPKKAENQRTEPKKILVSDSDLATKYASTRSGKVSYSIKPKK